MCVRRHLVLLGALLALALLCVPTPATARPLDMGAMAVDPGCTTDCIEPADTTAVLTTPGGNAGWHVASPVTVRLDGTDDTGVVSIDYVLDGVAGSQAPGTDLMVAGDLAHVLTHWAVDAAGNTSAPVSTTIGIDRAAPDNTTAAVSSAWRASEPTISVGAVDPVSGVQSVRWQVDSDPAGSSTTVPGSVTVTGDGVHTLTTWAIDRAGNQSVPRTDTVRIDSVAPVDVTDIASGWRNVSSVNVTVAGTDSISSVTRVAWELDGVPGQAFASSATVPVSGSGTHTLRTQVADAAGNLSNWREHTIRLDTTAPANTTPASDGLWRNTSYSVPIDGTDGGSDISHMEWKLDSEVPWRTAPPGGIITVSGTGDHVLYTRAVDRAGNRSGNRVEPVRIDLLPPIDSTAAVPGGDKADPYNLAIVGSDSHAQLNHIEWRVDSGATQTGPSGTQAVVTGDGTHVLQHRVVDRAGNASPWVSANVRINGALTTDTNPPLDETIVPSPWQTGDVNVTLKGFDSGRGLEWMEWRRAGGAIARVAPDTVLPFTGDGVHEFETRAVDKAGNASGWVPRTVRIDSVVPVDETAVPSGWTDQSTVTLAGSDATSTVRYVEWQLDGGTIDVNDPPGTQVTVSDGAHTLRHRAVDFAGQASAWVEDDLQVDTIDPLNTTPLAAAGWLTSAWAPTGAGTDAGGSGFDRVEWRLGSSGEIQTGPIVVDADGSHVLETRAVDGAGNGSAWRSETVDVDLLAPTDTTDPAPAAWRTTPWTVTPSADDGSGSGVDTNEWALDVLAAPSTGPVTVSTEGVTTFFTRTTDLVGHVSDWRSHTVRIDSVAPALSLDCGAATWRTAPVTCATAADGGHSGLESVAFTRAGAATAIGAGAPVTVAADGNWPVTLAAVDGAGNAAQAGATVMVDRTPPTTTLTCAEASTPLDWSCTVGASDATSGLASLRWRLDGGAWKPIAPGASFSVADGRVEVDAADAAGNRTTSPPAVLADRAKPAVTTGKQRSRSVPVTLRGTRGDSGLIGGFELRTLLDDDQRTAAAADVRPLVLGAGRFRLSIRLTSGQLSAVRVRYVRFRRSGSTPRMGVALTGVRHKLRARLVVERRSRGRWKRVALASTSMKP